MAYLTVADLSASADNLPILKKISFSVEKGSLTLIAGPNGSGKSYLLKCLKGLEKTDEGTIRVENKEMKTRKERMRFFGLVFQDTSLQIVGSTVEKDIAFGLENQKRSTSEIKAKTDEMLSLFSLDKERKRNPGVLSGGERRRLCIAGVMAMESPVLLLDEPLANLDYPSVKMVLNTLVSLKEKGITVLVVSHEAEKLLALTDNTIILRGGEIAASGKSRDMLQSLRDNDIYLPPLTFEDMKWI